MKILYLCITKAYNKKGDFKRPNVYECTRKFWALNSLHKAKEAEIIVGVANGKIKGIFKKTVDWQMVKDIPELQNDEELKAHPDYQTRYAFSGEEIKFDSEEAKEVFSYFENHPFKYCGYVERYSFD